MSFLTPLALALAALGLPILILYMLKLRREEQVVSSTMLWQQVLRDRQANAPWQRLRRNLLLLLQLLLLFLLVMALGRPYSEISRRVQGNVVVLLDASASMQATDVRPSRFEVARSWARQLIDGLGPNDTMTLIAVEDVPHVLEEFLSHPGPAFLEVIIDPEADVYPMVGPGLPYSDIVTGKHIPNRYADSHDGDATAPDESEMF